MFHVYVEGPTGNGVAAVRALADAMARRYGLSAQDLISRFARGRFRVKSNIDRRTADTYARDLEAIGARVKVEAVGATESSTFVRDEITLVTPPGGIRTAGPSTPPSAGERSPESPAIARETPFARPATPASSARTPSAQQRGFGPSTPPAGTRRPGAPSTPPLGTDPGTRTSGANPRASEPGMRTSGANPRAASPQPREPIASGPTRAPHRSASPSTSDQRAPHRSASPSTSDQRTPSPQRGASEPRGVSESRAPSPQRGTSPYANELGPPSRQHTSEPRTTPPPIGTDPGVPSPNPPMRTSPAIVVRPSSPSLPARPLSVPLPVVDAPVRPQSNSLPPSSSGAKPVPPSGLAAAYSSGSAPADLGALDDLTLSSLDGMDAPDVTIRPATAEFRPPEGAAPPTMPAKPAAKPAEVPLDLFAPPDAGDDKLDLQLMVEAPKPPAVSAPIPLAPRTAPIPVAPMAATPGVLSTPTLRPKIATPAAGIPRTANRPNPLAEPRVRFAAGVVLAIVLGFVPAHIIASLRERSAYASIDNEVTTTQMQATTPEAFAALDSFRDAELDAKYGKRRSIALTSMLIWALASGGLAYVWFRRVPWDRFA